MTIDVVPEMASFTPQQLFDELHHVPNRTLSDGCVGKSFLWLEKTPEFWSALETLYRDRFQDVDFFVDKQPGVSRPGNVRTDVVVYVTHRAVG